MIVSRVSQQFRIRYDNNTGLLRSCIVKTAAFLLSSRRPFSCQLGKINRKKLEGMKRYIFMECQVPQRLTKIIYSVLRTAQINFDISLCNCHG